MRIPLLFFCSINKLSREAIFDIKMEKDKSLPESYIANWFQNQVIFITGGTGFMGKVLVEKLLRDCPEIKKCYLLMRTKRGIEPEQRREDYINHMVYV